MARGFGEIAVWSRLLSMATNDVFDTQIPSALQLIHNKYVDQMKRIASSPQLPARTIDPVETW